MLEAEGRLVFIYSSYGMKDTMKDTMLVCDRF